MAETVRDATAGLSRSDPAIRRRRAAELRFRIYGLLSITLAVLALATLLGSALVRGIPGFFSHTLELAVDLDPAVLDPGGRGDAAALETADYAALLRRSLYALFPDVERRSERRALRALLSGEADLALAERVRRDPDSIGTRLHIALLLDDDVDQFLKRAPAGEGKPDGAEPGQSARLSPSQVGWLRALQERGLIARSFDWNFFRSGDSREPELAGIWGAVVGSAATLLVTLALSFPLGVAAAVYLEEFATANRWTELVEVNINNLAAVPSIVFGLLGLAVFLNYAGLPRSAPLVGGMVLALMTLPAIIIAARAALRSVPPSIREAALGLGATSLQTVTHHVLPLALPGILTGTIIGMARALGETAPLLMIGMVAFIADVPAGFRDPATVLPVQIYLWADSPEPAFAERAAAAILVLLLFLVVMNLTAILLRHRFERRW